ncbi:MAG: SBBP repeat-containing protein [Candidatus Firestonebacteria bacterium]
MKSYFTKTIIFIIISISVVLPASFHDSITYEKPEEFSGNFDARGNAICLDEEGNLYITGYNTEKGEGKNIWVQKFKGFDKEAWKRNYSGENKKDDEGKGIKTDSEGNVIVAGYETVKGPKKNIWIKKWGASGNVKWMKSIGVEYKADSMANGVSVDVSGNVYAAGFMSNKNNKPEGWLKKFDKDGKDIWQNIITGGPEDKSEVKAVAVDAEGKIFICGYSSVKGKSAEAFVQKLGSDGKEIWKTAVLAAPKKGIAFNAIALDAKGNIYTAGFQDSPGNGKDALIKKFDKEGRETMEIFYSGTAKLDDIANGIYVDGQDNIFVCGYTTGSRTQQDSFMIKYSPAGKDIMTRVHDSSGKNDASNAICLDAEGVIYITGFLGVDSTETDLWIKQYTQ